MAQAPKKANDAGANAEAAPKKKKLLMMIGVGVALVALSVGGTVVALKMLAPPAEAPAETAESHATLAPAVYVELAPNFVINYSVDGRQRYLQASITLMHRDPLLDSLLQLHMPAIRNALVMLLSSKDFNSLQTPEGKEQAKTEALTVIQTLLKKEQDALVASGVEEGLTTANIEQVLFTNFVMQ
ncbi:flagellar basal body-associated FliL family protein [Cellvibrio fontiphilus]|jgi:flagellar FliL protein|uniref:Flagellar protein FliL n=1 Tax=Cellvibrio fontiphilus TaxID=1815559 RepID=A0ABV7FCN4_9GAMM